MMQTNAIRRARHCHHRYSLFERRHHHPTIEFRTNLHRPFTSGGWPPRLLEGGMPTNIRLNRFLPSLRKSNISSLAFALPLEETRGFVFRCLGRHATLPEEDETVKTTILALSPQQVRPAPILRRVYNFFRWLLRECWDIIALTWRGSEILLRLSPMIILTPAAVLAHQYILQSNSGSSTSTAPLPKNHISDFAWWYLTSSMQALGPCFVKLCQWIATRRDMVPPHVCDRLAHLHDHGTPHSWKYTHAALTKAFSDYQAKGLEVHDVIGCGSAAQVYRAKLVTPGSREMDNQQKGDGTAGKEDNDLWVAVKVLHPKLDYLVERDMWLMDTVAKLVHSIPFEAIRMANLPRAASTFGNVLRRQVDLNVEASNLVAFRRNFYSSPREEKTSMVLFPRPVEGWVSREVLVEELIEDAKPIAEFLRDESEEGRVVRKELGSVLLRAFLKMVFLDNFVHADLHPGNCLVVTKQLPSRSLLERFWTKVLSLDLTANETKAETTRRKIVFLDAGIASSLSPNDQRNLLDLFRAVILNQGYDAGRLMVERARYERCSQVPGGVDAFSRGIENIVSEFHDNRKKEGLSLGAVRIGSLLGRVLDLCRVHGVEIDPAMSSVVISTLVLEGLGRSLDPNLNLIDFSIPFVLGRGRV